nr:helix-turn-helix domain-containing protein [Candidatus Njordarchaeota archaeon]
MGPRIKIAIDTLLPEERAYLLGLYFTDGSLCHEKSSYRVQFYFGNSETRLAERTIVLLKRLGLNPKMSRPKGRNYLAVRASASNLVSFFPEKDRFLTPKPNEAHGWARYERLEGNLGIPFIAGLLDGDGYLRIAYDKRSILGIDKCWSFAQVKFKFLADFLVDYVKKLATRGTRVSMMGNGRINVTILASGEKALLQKGIEKWSVKVADWARKLEKMKSKILTLRSRFHTVPEAAYKLGVARASMLLWCRRGIVRHLCIRSYRRVREIRSLSLIPAEEIERLRAFLAENEYKAKGSSHKLLTVIEATKLLKLCRSRIEECCKNGELKAVSLSTIGGDKKYLIPIEEVKRFVLHKRRA